MATFWKRGHSLKNMRIRLIASAALLLASHAVAQPQNGLNLMPMPTSVQPGVGRLPVDQSFSVAITGFNDATLERGIHRFVASLSRQTGMFLKQKLVDSPSPTLLIHALHGRESVQRLSEDESYELVRQRVRCEAHRTQSSGCPAWPSDFPCSRTITSSSPSPNKSP